jgi:beta-galactosidase
MKHVAVAYYPEHCEEARWPRDLELMKSHGIDMVRILEFAWSRMERADDQWDFGWVHRFMRLAEQAGIKVVPCTPSAAPPVWLTKAHPECLNVNAQGVRTGHGARRQYCPTARVYRDFSNRIAARMQQELAGYGNVAAWQIDNELGFNRCFCPQCDASFRQWAKDRYGSLEALNADWGGAFWSEDHWDWDHLVVPRQGLVGISPEMQQSLYQFYSDAIIGFYREQHEALRRAGCGVPISTNMMGNFEQIDYWKLGAEVDFVGWDNYWFVATLASESFQHHLMRSLKSGAPYWTFENGVETYPGFNIIHALNAWAHGEEVHTIFRWDSCRFAQEMDLQGLVDWSGRPRHKLAEIKEARRLLDEVGALELPPVQPRVAMVYSYQNNWAMDRYYSYWNEVNDYYQALLDMGIPCDCVQPSGDLGKYDLVLAPGLGLVSDGELENVRRYVVNGGTLVSGRKAFTRLPGGSYRNADHPVLPDVFGLRVAETMTDEDSVTITASIYKPPFPRRQFTLQGAAGLPETKTRGWFETLEPSTAEVLYRYRDGDFPDAPAVCRNRCGKGQAFYIGVMADREAMRSLLRLAVEAARLRPVTEVPQGALVVPRGDACVLLNFTAQPLTVPLCGVTATLAGARWDPQGGAVTLPPFGYSVVQTVQSGLSRA